MSLAITTPAHLASRVLAPASSPAHPVSLSQYATQSWSRGGVILGLVILVVLFLAVSALTRKGKSASK